MIRVTPWDDPNSCGTAKRSRPRTRRPRRASSNRAALPIPPTPTTIASKRSRRTCRAYSQPTGLSDVVVIAGGNGYHLLALASDGSLWAWGDNYKGQIGDGTTTTRGAPVRVARISPVATMSGGFQHSAA